MANPHRGEVALVLDGVTYTLMFSVNALCDLEEKFDKPINEILAGLSESSGLKTLRTLVRCGLSQKHPEITESIAGDLLSFGNSKVVMEKIGEALSLAFPKNETSEVSSTTENPQ